MLNTFILLCIFSRTFFSLRNRNSVPIRQLLISPSPSSWKEVPDIKGFPESSVGKESTCNAGDSSSIPGLGRSTGEGIGYPLQCSWASPVAQLVKNPPVMLETWVQSLGWDEPLEKGKATQSSILAWRIPSTVQSMGSQRVRQNWATFTSLLLETTLLLFLSLILTILSTWNQTVICLVVIGLFHLA